MVKGFLSQTSAAVTGVQNRSGHGNVKLAVNREDSGNSSESYLDLKKQDDSWVHLI